MNNIKKNFIYNISYQLLLLLIPLITVPYTSRVLGANGIGQYSYTYSIVNYFMLIALLGINNHGNRTIAKSRENKKELSKNFIGIYSIQVIMSFLMIISYIAYLLLFNIKYKTIATIQIIHLISNTFDINWFFFGIEKFKITVTRSTIIKILSLILIFTLVKNQNDIWIYTIILSGSTLISQLILFPFLKKEIEFTKINISDIKKHIVPCLIMFIPVISISLYKVMDKIMLGAMANVTEVGYYEQAEKIINIPMSIITALGTVMMPRISNLISKGNKKQIYDYIFKSINFMMFLAFPICLGLIAVSSRFIPIFMGDEFIKTSKLINYLSITIIFISFANVIRKQYLVPMEYDKIFILSVISGALVNLMLNFLLIPRYNSEGASIATVIAELMVMGIQIIAVRKELPILQYFKSISSFIAKSLIMFTLVIIIGKIKMNNIAIICIQVIIGSIVYFILNLKYINSIINFKKIIKR